MEDSGRLCQRQVACRTGYFIVQADSLREVLTRSHLPDEFTYVVVAAVPLVGLQPILELNVHCFERIPDFVGLQIDASGFGRKPGAKTILLSANLCV